MNRDAAADREIGASGMHHGLREAQLPLRNRDRALSTGNRKTAIAERRLDAGSLPAPMTSLAHRRSPAA